MPAEPVAADRRESAGWELLDELRRTNTASYPADFARQLTERGYRISKQHLNRAHPALYAAVSAWGQKTTPHLMRGRTSRPAAPPTSRARPTSGPEQGRKAGAGLRVSTNDGFEKSERLQAEVEQLTRRCGLLERCIEQMLLVAAEHDRAELLPAMERAVTDAKKLGEADEAPSASGTQKQSAARLRVEK